MRRLWGEATGHAVAAFPVSGRPMPVPFLDALVRLKRAAAETNRELGLLDGAVADAIVAAAGRLLAGGLWDQFPVDLYQTGSATSSNMNANEVIAALAGEADPSVEVLPHEHVNRCQSSNDVVPSAMRIATAVALRRDLLPALDGLHAELAAKTAEFWEVLKVARTHLQDATPMRLGQEFHGWAGQVAGARGRIERALTELGPLPLGGTAVGTGLNAHPEFAARTAARLSAELGVELSETDNHFCAQSTLDDMVSAHAAVRTAALALHKVGCDIRLLATGPRAGLGELRVPDVKVSSSIMPGKVPPSVIESLTMVVARVVGNDATVAFSQTGSILELNVMMPVVIDSALESIELLSAATRNVTRQCVRGLEATEVGPAQVRRSVMLTTALSPHIGYAAAAEITRDALASGEEIERVALRHGISAEQFAAWCDPVTMTGDPHLPGTAPPA
ncbi:class II fumarate hydratase [Streptomyces sp. SBT349]|uniref:class II fumarate hydratase n=1 Tax=Streptomyces sp. SBT349 TaxID=1580539 RepID=UPI00069E9DDB|nr:class II fumarate hydratase [Streptomyces sp. SBT349]